MIFGIYTYSPREGIRDHPTWARTQSAEGITGFLKEAAELGNGWWIWNEHGDPPRVLDHVAASMSSSP